RLRDNEIAVLDASAARRNNESAVALPRKDRDSASNCVAILQIDRRNLQAKRRSRGLDCPPLADPRADSSIAEHREPRQTWCDLPEQLYPPAPDGVFEALKTGRIAARSREALYEARSDRIGNNDE